MVSRDILRHKHFQSSHNQVIWTDAQGTILSCNTNVADPYDHFRFSTLMASSTFQSMLCCSGYFDSRCTLLIPMSVLTSPEALLNRSTVFQLTYWLGRGWDVKIKTLKQGIDQCKGITCPWKHVETFRSVFVAFGSLIQLCCELRSAWRACKTKLWRKV